MNAFELTRALVDIESITSNEENVGNFLFDRLSGLAGAQVERMPVEPRRFNVFARWGNPVVVLSTHMDTVPPFFASREDDEFIHGRGACDTKGIIASMIAAAENLLREGVRDFGLLFVVGEERNSAGAFAAAKDPRGSRYLINGEPTENKLALGSKGALRYEIVAHGKMAHSAYPHLGDSAIEKLLDVLQCVRSMPLPSDPLFGPSTVNIGTIQGGRAPNVIPDLAKAEIFFRLVDDGSKTRSDVGNLVGQASSLRAGLQPAHVEADYKSAAGSKPAPHVDVDEVLCIPAMRFGTLDGFETSVVSFATDIPAFAGAWGEPYLLGPGTIHLAHTAEERIPKSEILEAIQIYQNMVRQLLRK